MNYISKLFLSFCLVAGFGAVTVASAQIESDATIKANIPHSFVVRDTKLPAGRYTIKVADDEYDLNTLEIRSDDGRTAVFLETEPIHATRTSAKSELVFDKIGDQYFLSRVFLKGDDSGNQVLESKKQQKLQAGGMTAEKHSVAGEMGRAIKSVGKKMR